MAYTFNAMKAGYASGMKRMSITAERLQELLDYDPETGFFTWKKGPRAGSIAGYWRTCDGYNSIMLYKKNYLGHRLAWLYVYGSMPEQEIDHINGIRADNRLVNLRKATRAENAANCRKRSSISKLKGAFWQKDRNNFMAKIEVNDRQIYLGRFPTAEEAHAAYCAAAKKYFGEFARTA